MVGGMNGDAVGVDSVVACDYWEEVVDHESELFGEVEETEGLGCRHFVGWCVVLWGGGEWIYVCACLEARGFRL